MNQDMKYPTGNEVYWEKWIDAFNNEEFNQELENLSSNEIDSDDEFGDNAVFNDAASILPKFEAPIKTIMTPWGVLPLTEHSLASNHFNFWVGHTNFRLTNRHYNVIGNVLGVESVDIMTPLRFKIAIGKLFEGNEVKYNVRQALLESVSNESKK